MDPTPPEGSEAEEAQVTEPEIASEIPNNREESQAVETSSEDLSQPLALDNEESSEDDGPEAELSDEDSDRSEFFHVPSITLVELPMPDVTEFAVPLPPELQPEEEAPEIPDVPRVPVPLPRVIHVSDLLKPLDSGESGPSFEDVKVVHVGREAGLTGEMQATYLCLPPGTRTSRPLAQRLGDSITYCISGHGLIWQNGWTFPFETTDTAGWKGGTGIAHTIINDSNRDGSPGEDLILITAHEVRDGESFSYPLDSQGEDTATNETEEKLVWKDPPLQGELGQHPGVPSVSTERGNQCIPEPQQGYRPSNVINVIAKLDTIGEGELFANATSLSQETGLSGRFGCNFEVPPPGTRSSDPHAHSVEDELVYVVTGNGLVWINGHVQPVREGDAVSFPGGTGVAHNFINDSNADGAEGEPLILWIIGQNRVKDGDLVYYPLHVQEKSKSRRWWADCPKHELGPHNGRPQRPFKH